MNRKIIFSIIAGALLAVCGCRWTPPPPPPPIRPANSAFVDKGEVISAKINIIKAQNIVLPSGRIHVFNTKSLLSDIIKKRLGEYYVLADQRDTDFYFDLRVPEMKIYLNRQQGNRFAFTVSGKIIWDVWEKGSHRAFDSLDYEKSFKEDYCLVANSLDAAISEVLERIFIDSTDNFCKAYTGWVDNRAPDVNTPLTVFIKNGTDAHYMGLAHALQKARFKTIYTPLAKDYQAKTGGKIATWDGHTVWYPTRYCAIFSTEQRGLEETVRVQVIDGSPDGGGKLMGSGERTYSVNWPMAAINKARIKAARDAAKYIVVQEQDGTRSPD